MYLIIDYWMILEKRPRCKTWHAPEAFGEYVPWERPLSLDCNLAFRDALDPLIKQFCLLFGFIHPKSKNFPIDNPSNEVFRERDVLIQQVAVAKDSGHQIKIRKLRNWLYKIRGTKLPRCERAMDREREREREVSKMSCNANRLNSFQTSIIIPTKMMESSKVLLKHLRLSSLPSSFLSTFSERNHPNHPIEKTNPRSQNWKLNSSNWTAYAWLCAVLCTQRASSWRFGLQKGPIGDGFSDGLWVKKLRFAVPCRKILGNTYVVVL